ncbi:hypothetical protein [Ammoniphilus sp. CFH 90114]|uniref:putative amidoligase domain-containing protein n=1 Tax=Ammoniphilus sp. CFH 90114 TaxID=2493665 RepID=UPI00100DEC30|nr:hypothetical protein [Ammoniphilus sp. CFH 90114]RXT15198.1 hypothetical protein EIZ39_03025 [Ammoniphilus sp. CFH 90114]
MSAFLIYSKQNSLAPLLSLLKIPSGTTLTNEDADVVIQWGGNSFTAQDPSRHVLNGAEGLANVSNRRLMLDMLKWNGIPTVDSNQRSSKVSTIRRYFVTVFQQQELALFRSRGRKVWLTNEISASTDDSYEEIPMNRSVREVRKVLRLAVRSLYSVGLDFGGVLIAIGLNGGMQVIDITPTPRLNGDLAQKFANAIHEYVAVYSRKPKPVTLGADPEFVLRNKTSGKMVLASRYFGKKGKVGCDHIWLRSDQTRKQLPLAELRPDPTQDPRQLTVNLYKTMLFAEKKIGNSSIEWLAGGMPLKGYPIGGHIHFSRAPVNSSFLRALDSYLALPLMLIENHHSLNRRPKYGFLGDFRKQFHGGFEYRTLPSWLVSPRVTKGVLALAKLIAESYTELHQLPVLNPTVQRAFYEGNKDIVLSAVHSVWAKLEKTNDYSKYQHYINPLRDMMFRMEVWNEFQDIRVAWQIPPYSHKKSLIV